MDRNCKRGEALRSRRIYPRITCGRSLTDYDGQIPTKRLVREKEIARVAFRLTEMARFIRKEAPSNRRQGGGGEGTPLKKRSAARYPCTNEKPGRLETTIRIITLGQQNSPHPMAGVRVQS